VCACALKSRALPAASRSCAATSLVGPAGVFEDEPDAIDALVSRKIKPGDVMVIRYEGPHANGMPEMYFAAAILAADPALNRLQRSSPTAVTRARCAARASGTSRPRRSTAARSR
jgi:dihydroxyacid dehydratase/phosphogluconate dehydratase